MLERSLGRTAALGLATVPALGILLAMAPAATADHAYREEVWHTWETTELDVAVLGVGDPFAGEAIDHAVEAWQTGIAATDPGPPLSDLVIRSYIPVVDEGPPPGYEPHDPEIVFVPYGGMAVQTDHTPLTKADCVAMAPSIHSLEPGPNGSYETAAHELGHCLGLSHVFEHEQEYEPRRDLMGGGADVRACPSNLNLQVLDHVFSGERIEVVMPAGEYRQTDCANGDHSQVTEALALVAGQLPQTG